uniref:Uncharacterized protein n=1 Tax=Plectus sambesii TaxID=2011161 RepID=A0A914VG59_9BILA
MSVMHIANIQTFDMYFRTALHWTGRLGLTEASEKLMSSGAKPDTRDSQGATPLHYAALFGHVDTLKALLINNGNKV